MRERVSLLAALLLLVLISTWFLRALDEEPPLDPRASHEPDAYMTNFNTLTMGEDGRAKHRLSAGHMSRYVQDGTTELTGPRVELFRRQGSPVELRADRGWLAADDEVALLHGNVRLLRIDAAGARLFEVRTAKARVLLSEEYADTDAEVVLLKGRVAVDSIGMRAYLRENRLTFDRHVQTTIAPPAAPRH